MQYPPYIVVLPKIAYLLFCLFALNLFLLPPTIYFDGGGGGNFKLLLRFENENEKEEQEKRK